MIEGKDKEMKAMQLMEILGTCADTTETPEALVRHAQRKRTNEKRLNLSERQQKLNVLFAVQQAC